MKIDFQAERPIFLQISEGLEDDILSGNIPEEEQIPSITELSVLYKINPATANKGINLLVDRGIVYKKRGVGMFVSRNAVSELKKERREGFFAQYIQVMVEEARRLELTQEDILQMVGRCYSA